MTTTPEVTKAVDAIRTYVHQTDNPFESLTELEKAIKVVTREEVRRARNLGAPWTIIAERLGITRQTAVSRYQDGTS